MSRSLAPELVTAGDVLEYDLDSSPVDARDRASYLERLIHGEIYKARPDVRAIVHNHSPSVIPFGVTGRPAESGCARSPGRSCTTRSEEHTSELQSQSNLVCRLLLE